MRRRGGWTAYAPLTREARAVGQQPAADGGDRPELADVGRLARRLVRQVVHADAHLAAALDQLLDTRNQLTRVLLGGRRGAGGEGAPPGPGFPHPEPYGGG